MTAQQLAAALGIPLPLAQQWAGALNAAMARFEINTPQRQAAFLAQIGHESVLLTHLSENLNYSADGLLKYFHSHFTAAEAHAFQFNPVAIANRVYADRYGNGDEASGDGWKYRGAGLIQLTFKNNQGACGTYFGIPPDKVGDWLRTTEGAALSAAWYWKTHRCNELADAGDFRGITININGGTNGLEQRQALYNRALPVMAKP